MSVIEIQKAIQQLSDDDFNNLMVWIAEYKNNKWDEQIAEDYKEGRLNELINSALSDIESGNVKEI
jgi:hypothetical protein